MARGSTHQSLKTADGEDGNRKANRNRNRNPTGRKNADRKAAFTFMVTALFLPRNTNRFLGPSVGYG